MFNKHYHLSPFFAFLTKISTFLKENGAFCRSRGSKFSKLSRNGNDIDSFA